MNGAIGAVTGSRLWFFSADRKENLKAEFERVTLPQLSHLYTSALYLTKDKAKAEDLVQETYLRAFRFYPGSRGIAQRNKDNKAVIFRPRKETDHVYK